ncbi:MAG: GNAT family N-acetyltransferase [Anaerolineae bacterium]|nr:GNAT family N-acetyltransferase [Anaerolineae bacterium]
MVILETERLILRQFEKTDAVAMSGVFGDPDVMRFGPGVQMADWVSAWIRVLIEEVYPTRGYGLWAVVEKSQGAFIGYCGLFHFDDLGGQPEIEVGYRLARTYWGLGYATEAVCGVRDYAFSKLGITRLVALIDPQNGASIRVAEKAGMRYEKDVLLEGYDHPDHLYVISRSQLSIDD